MPIFELTGPDGAKYRLEAPDENAALAAFSAFQGGANAQAPEPEGPPKAPDRGITADDLVRSAARGIPVLGGAMDRIAAAGDAALGAVIDRGSQAETFAERYAENLANEQRRDREFDENSPIASTVAKVVGGVGGLAPAVMAAPAAFGAVGTLPQMIARGAASGAGISAADALVRGDDPTTAAVIGGGTGAAAPLVGRAIGEVARAMRGRPAPVPQYTETVAGVKIPFRQSQITGDVVESAEEQALLRGGRGEAPQRAAQEFEDLAAQRVGQASENIGAGLAPGGAVRTAPQDAGERVIAEVSQAEADRVSREAAAIAAAQREAEALRRQVGAGDAYLPAGRGVVAESPFAAAEQVGAGVRQQAAQARNVRTQLYDAYRNVPGEFEPAAFTQIGNSLRTRLSGAQTAQGTPQQAVRITDELTPRAAEALRILDESVGNLTFPNAALPAAQRAAPRPITGDTIEEARKQLTQLYGDARRASMGPSGNQADVRAMDRVIEAFDDHVEAAVRAGAFSGDPEALLRAGRVARAAHAAYRRNFTPQGPGDEVGRAVEKILGRYDGQAATPDEIARLSYGPANAPGGAQAIKVAQRLRYILGENSEGWQAYKQGLVSHLIDNPGAAPLTPTEIADRLTKFLEGTQGRGLANLVFSAEERRAFAAFADSLRRAAPRPRPTSDVDKALARIAGADGGLPATPGEVVDMLFSRTGKGDKGLSVRLAQRLKNDLPEDAWNMVRQGMWAKLTDAGEGKIPFEVQALSQRIHEFLNESGRSLAHVMFSQAERQQMQQLANVYKRMIPVKGTTNPSGTAPMLAKIANAASNNLLAMLGGVQGGFTGLAVGAAGDRALRAVSNRRAAKDVVRRFYGDQPRAPLNVSRAPVLIGQGVAPQLN